MVKFPGVTVQLVGHDGNVFAIMGRVSAALRVGLDREEGRSEAKQYCDEVMKCGSYSDALELTMRWVTVL